MPIALWCDYRIATSDVDMHFGNLSRGMSPAGQLSQLLRDYLSPSDIMKTYLENSHWDCNDLLRLKIVSSVAKDKSQALSHAKKLASFIAQNPSQAVRDTLHLVKLSYAADVADEESWLIAKKITESNELFHKKNDSFLLNGGIQHKIESAIPLSSDQTSFEKRTPIGIIAMEVYTPGFSISADVLEQQGILARRKQGQEAVAVWDDQEDSISMAMTAVAKLLEKHVSDPYSIRRMEVGTESNIDLAKSIKSYLMDLFPADHVNIEGVDNTNACYGGTAALLNTISWSRETGGYGIVVATDTADMDLHDSSWRGASAVAMLVGPNPWVEIHPERVSCFKNTHDFLKPRYSNQVTPHMQTQKSMNYYIEALDTCIKSFNDEFSMNTKEFDAFVFHGGLCATFMTLVERHLIQVNDRPKNWKIQFEQAKSCAKQMGGLYTASLYVNLISLLHKDNQSNPEIPLNEIGMFAYGSGSTATLLHATIHHNRAHQIDLPSKLQQRNIVSFDTLSKIVQSHKMNDTPVGILERCKGVYYRDFSKIRKGSFERFYHLHQQSNTESSTFHPTLNTVDMHNSSYHQRDNISDIKDTLKGNYRKLSSVAILVGWIWWIVASIFFSSSKPVNVFVYATVTFAVTFLLNSYIKECFKKGDGWSYMFGHYVIGIFTHITYAILLCTSRPLLMNVWRSIYFGWYSYDSLYFIITWRDLSHNFCIFNSIHHSLSLICTGTWIAVGGNWNDQLITALIIWLTSDIWHYALSANRFISVSTAHGWRLTASEAVTAEIVAFWMERIHRCVSYAFVFFIEEKSQLFWLIFGSGILFDVIDCPFRILSIQARRAELLSQQVPKKAV